MPISVGERQRSIAEKGPEAVSDCHRSAADRNPTLKATMGRRSRTISQLNCTRTRQQPVHTSALFNAGTHQDDKIRLQLSIKNQQAQRSDDGKRIRKTCETGSNCVSQLDFFAVLPSPARTETTGWQQSHDAGYSDRNGKYCGGSKIMHLVPSQGKPASNGYWEDDHWKVPSSYSMQSTQVLGLDLAKAIWEFDLETDETGLPHMTGSILKSMIFFRT